MMGRWSNYRLRMRGFRQKYLTFMRKKINAQKSLLMIDMRRKIFRGFAYTIILGTGYYYGNKIYSQYHEIKQVKEKLFRDYPSQVCYIGIGEKLKDIEEIISEINVDKPNESEKIASPKKLQDNLKTLTNKPNYIIVLEEDQEIKHLKQIFGGSVTIFTPYHLDQLCNVIELCHKYRHKALTGNFPIFSQKFQKESIIETLKKIPKPIQKQKYVLINLSKMKKIKFDQIDSTIELDTGISCKQINDTLQKNGYQHLFPPFLENQSLYDVIVNNYPLYQNHSLAQQLINLTLVSAEGTKFRSSTQVGAFGQIPNLTSLFVGTGGAFAIPAQAKIKIKPKINNISTYLYSMNSQDKSQLILKFRKINKFCVYNDIQYSLLLINSKLFIRTNIEIVFPDQKFDWVMENKQIKDFHFPAESKNQEMIFGVNNKIIEQLILNPSPLNLSFDKGILYAGSAQNILSNQRSEALSKLVSKIALGGGILIWTKNSNQKSDLNFSSSSNLNESNYEHIKNRTDLPQTGAELMKKIVQIREAIDKRHVLDSHERYQKYYKKNMFRKMTEFFW